MTGGKNATAAAMIWSTVAAILLVGGGINVWSSMKGAQTPEALSSIASTDQKSGTLIDSSTPSLDGDIAPRAGSIAATKWYEGGALHGVDGHQWVKAREENRFATAADLAVIVIGQEKVAQSLASFDEFRPYAREMKICLDAFYNSAEERRHIMRSKPVASVAAMCATGVEGMWRRDGH